MARLGNGLRTGIVAGVRTLIDGNAAETGVVAAVDLESEDEGVVAVALLGHLGAEVAAEDLFPRDGVGVSLHPPRIRM